MGDFKWSKWIKISLFFNILMLQFRGTTGEDSHLVVGEGEEVTLPCKCWINHQDKEIAWLLSSSPSSKTVELMCNRQDDEEDKPKSDRLSVTEDFSLVIKAITVNDVGQYTCRCYEKSEEYQSTLVYLSIIIIHGDTAGDRTKLTCSVLRYGQCAHTVEWLSDGTTGDVTTSRGTCSAAATFAAPRSDQAHRESLRCQVADGDGRSLRLCTFNSQPSCGKTVSGFSHWWIYVTAVVGSATIVAAVGAFVTWRRRTGHRTWTDKNTEVTPAVAEFAPQTSRDTVDPDDGVFYSSVTVNKKSESKGRVQTKIKDDDDDDDDDEGVAVIYSGVKASQSSWQRS